jgi:hypothetical protein
VHHLSHLIWTPLEEEEEEEEKGPFQQVLPQCTALPHLDLSSNSIGSLGAEIEVGQRCAREAQEFDVSW